MGIPSRDRRNNRDARANQNTNDSDSDPSFQHGIIPPEKRMIAALFKFFVEKNIIMYTMFSSITRFVTPFCRGLKSPEKLQNRREPKNIILPLELQAWGN